jgi:predicted ATPase
MRIERLEIPNHRNLRNFRIAFDETAPMTVLLGPNGSGKSNLIENLVEIFLALEKGEAPSFKYSMTYYCYGKRIEVAGDPDAGSSRERLQIRVDGREMKAAAFRRAARDHLPAHIFAYYSGTNARLEKLFAEPTKRYYKANLNETRGRGAGGGDDAGLRRFFLCRKDYAELAFLALFFEDQAFAQHLRRDVLGFEQFDSALFVLKTPWWAQSKTRSDFYWGARGSFTAFLDRLREAALAPIKNEESLEFDVRGRTQGVERLYLFIQSLEHLNRLRESGETSKLMFNHLESMYLSDLLEEVRVNGRHASGQRVSVHQLSEGERQLVIVFGLLLFTHEDEVLYLLDEPDSYLNPRWVYEYMDWLGRAFRDKEGPPTANDSRPENPLLRSSAPTVPGASQVLLATHNPLMIGPLRRNQVRLMQQEAHGTTALPPEYDPVGVGVEGLLKSDVFGLRSTLAPEVMQKVDEHYQLLGKADRSAEDDLELRRLDQELNELAVSRTHPNPYFEQFAMAMARRTPNPEPVLSPEDLEAQKQLADEILKELLEEERAERSTAPPSTARTDSSRDSKFTEQPDLFENSQTKE